MLAQNFMSAEALDLPTVERDALVAVLGMLERGDIAADTLRMDVLLHQVDGCATVGCLCGWAHVVSHGTAFPELAATPARGAFVAYFLRDSLRRRLPENVKRLFYFGAWSSEMAQITPPQAATALRNFLTTGDAQWETVRAA